MFNPNHPNVESHTGGRDGLINNSKYKDDKSANSNWKKSAKQVSNNNNNNSFSSGEEDTCSDYINDEEYYSDDSFVTIDDDENENDEESSGNNTDDTLAYESNSTDSAIGIESFCVNPYFVSN